jgi:hypothetical protein
MGVIEQVIRPFATEDAAPQAFTQPGTVGVPPAVVTIKFGGGKSFNGKLSYQRNTKLGAVHDETASPSKNIQTNCGTAANAGSAIANNL